MDNNLFTKTISKELPCKLTQEEQARYGQMLSSKVRERDLIDEERKSTAAEYGARIKGTTSEISRIAAALDKGEEIRPVDCHWQFHAGTMQLVRVDTGAVVTVRPATQEERQLSLGEALAEEQPENGAPGFPTLEDGPRGDELSTEDEPEPPKLELVESSSGDTVAVMPDDDEDGDDPFAHGETGNDEPDLDSEFDAAYEERKALKENVDDPVTGGETKSAEVKPPRKRGTKGTKAKK